MAGKDGAILVLLAVWFALSLVFIAALRAPGEPPAPNQEPVSELTP